MSSSEALQAAKVYRELLKAVKKHIPKEDGKKRFKEYVTNEFRNNSTLSDPSSVHHKIKLARDYTLLLNSVHHHKAHTFSISSHFFLIKNCSFSKGAVLVTIEVFDMVLCNLIFFGLGGWVGVKLCVYLLGFETMTWLFVHSYGGKKCHLSDSSLGEELILLMVWIWCCSFLVIFFLLWSYEFSFVWIIFLFFHLTIHLLL